MAGMRTRKAFVEGIAGGVEQSRFTCGCWSRSGFRVNGSLFWSPVEDDVGCEEGCGKNPEVAGCTPLKIPGTVPQADKSAGDMVIEAR